MDHIIIFIIQGPILKVGVTGVGILVRTTVALLGCSDLMYIRSGASGRNHGQINVQ